ncbi:MAG: flagellin, partial [Verrucomicrobiales bacterium]|nr:flagellin [Verrucomicrobiales bacterium]
MRLEAQINRNSAVRANVGNAVSFVQTQDGFLQKVQSALDRMSELSVLSQDVTKSNSDRSNYSVEF